MATMWVLIWFQATQLEIEYFQLGSFESAQKCAAALTRAEVMVTSTITQVACLQIGVGRHDD
jgi:hypothetical protein